MPEETEVVTTAQAIDRMFDNEINAQVFRSSEAIRKREVPAGVLQTRPGRGGVFTYVPHGYGTELLLDAMPERFSHEVLDYEIFPDYSAVARVRLQIHTPLKQGDGTFLIHTTTITEIGAFQGSDKMLDAHKIASAASRGLMKCLMRRFGVGLELYRKEDPDAMTAGQAWGGLLDTGYRKRGVKKGAAGEDERKAIEEAIVEIIKDAGITSLDLVERFEEAYFLVNQWAKDALPYEEMVKKLDDEEPAGKDAPELVTTTKEQEQEIDALVGWGPFYDYIVKNVDGYSSTEEVQAGLEKVYKGDKDALLEASKMPMSMYVLLVQHAQAG